MDYNQMTLLVIAGGKSERMGQDKRWMFWQGKSFIAYVLEKAAIQDFYERILCVEAAAPQWQALAEQYGLRIVFDQRKGFGPAEGLRQGLTAMRTPYALAVSADMPFLDFTVLAALGRETGEAAAVLPIAAGRQQPLAALYNKNFLTRLAEEKEERKLGRLLAYPGVRRVSFPMQEAMFFNVNTPAELRMARGRQSNASRRVPVVTVTAAQSNMGKTQFIVQVLPYLIQRGFAVGVVKSTHHVPAAEEAGKDSQRFRRAGAKAVSVVSSAGQAPLMQRERLLAAAEAMQSVDVVLLETRSQAIEPAIEILPSSSTVPSTADDVLTAILTDAEEAASQQIYQLSWLDLQTAAKWIAFLVR